MNIGSPVETRSSFHEFTNGGGSSLELDDWAKHHKQISILVKRKYLDDGEVINPKSEKYLTAMKNHCDRIIEKKQEVIHSETFKTREVIDSYLVLDNLDPIESSVDYYSVGAMNTEQTTYMKLVFQLDDVRVILDYNYKSSGSYASSFSDMIDSSGISHIISEIANNDKGIKDKGIMVNENEYGDYYIIGVDDVNRIKEFEVDESDLVSSLVSVEMYKFDMEILDL